MRAQIKTWGLLVLMLLGFTLLYFQSGRPAPVPNQPIENKATFTRPVRIRIPAINVDAAIESVGVLADGSMGVPKTASDTAWYQLGPRPGEVGSAVIAGHLDWIGGKRAVFSDLHNLKPGDKVMVQDEQGTIMAFTVRESRSYDAKADAAGVFLSNDGKAHLNLITCQGVWVKNQGSYSNRLVVFLDQTIEKTSTSRMP